MEGGGGDGMGCCCCSLLTSSTLHTIIATTIRIRRILHSVSILGGATAGSSGSLLLLDSIGEQ